MGKSIAGIISGKKYAAAIIACALILLILALAYFSRPQEPQGPGLKYFELVMEKQDCPQGACFVEYIFVSNGMLVKKQYDLPNYQGTPVFELRNADPAAISGLFGAAGRLSSENGNVQNPGSEHNYFFYYDGQNLSAFSMPDPPQAGFALIFQEAGTAFENARDGGGFYIHTYYQPQAGDAQDLHVFSDGTMIKSVFSSLNNSLLSTSMLRASGADLQKISGLASNAAEAAPDSTSCANTGMVYGAVELEFNRTYAAANTCGSGNGSFSALFEYLHGKY
ncbi:MAG TPA: hypothetical protein PLO51_04250 [Candidatus Micrarchaeota archaeon]|nr:hypothetical protein [Candidatus Micrarchaeota archaeon]